MNCTDIPSASRRPRIPRTTVVAVLAVAVLAAGAGAPALQAQVAPRARATETPRADLSLRSQLFHVTLVAAARDNGSRGGHDLPPAVAKALADIEEFLPYKAYRVVDSALVRGSDEAHTRLVGPASTPYEVTILFRGAGAPDQYLIDRFTLEKTATMEDMARSLERAGKGDGAVAPLPPEQSLTASFGIARGETVVVGSSRIGGDEALIVLLTAVP